MAGQRPTIKIIDVQRSSPGKLFESEMYLHIWEAKEGKLRGQGWIPKNEIEKIEVTEVADGLENTTVEIEEAVETTETIDLTESDTEDTDEDEDLDDFDLMELDALKKECQKRNIHYTKKATENSLRNKLRA